MSYLQIYLYCIKNGDREEFLNLMRDAREIYREHGAEGETLFLLRSKERKYGLTGIWEAIEIEEDEEIWVGLDHYDNEDHCRRTMDKVDADPRIDPLYERVVQMVGSASRIIRGEFEEVR